MTRNIAAALAAILLMSGLAPAALAQTGSSPVVGGQGQGNRPPAPGDDLTAKKIEATLRHRGYSGFAYAWPDGDGWRVQAVKDGNMQMVWVEPSSGQIIPQGSR